MQLGVRADDLIIGDDNYTDHIETKINGEKMRRGRVPRNYRNQPHCFESFMRAVDFPLIPETEWPDRIRQQEKDKSRMSDIVLDNGIPSLNQAQTNFCWANGPVTAMLGLRAKMNLPYVALSPASVACPINGFVNRGGLGTQAIRQMAKAGVAKAELWPANAIDRRYYTDATKADAMTRQVTDWYDLDPSNLFKETATLVLRNILVPVGYDWWGHEVCAFDLVMVAPGQYGLRIRNSWSDTYGQLGFAILTGRKMIPDDACAPIVVEATEG
jgi:hypothetical protein